MEPEAEDLVDGCELDFDTDDNCEDEHVDAVALFADIDWTDPSVVAVRKQEWEQLHGS